jgi:hypothetical protein
MFVSHEGKLRLPESLREPLETPRLGTVEEYEARMRLRVRAPPQPAKPPPELDPHAPVEHRSYYFQDRGLHEPGFLGVRFLTRWRVRLIMAISVGSAVAFTTATIVYPFVGVTQHLDKLLGNARTRFMDLQGAPGSAMSPFDVLRSAMSALSGKGVAAKKAAAPAAVVAAPQPAASPSAPEPASPVAPAPEPAPQEQAPAAERGLC